MHVSHKIKSAQRAFLCNDSIIGCRCSVPLQLWACLITSQQQLRIQLLIGAALPATSVKNGTSSRLDSRPIPWWYSCCCNFLSLSRLQDCCCCTRTGVNQYLPYVYGRCFGLSGALLVVMFLCAEPPASSYRCCIAAVCTAVFLRASGLSLPVVHTAAAAASCKHLSAAVLLIFFVFAGFFVPTAASHAASAPQSFCRSATCNKGPGGLSSNSRPEICE